MAEMSKRITWMGECQGSAIFVDPDLPSGYLIRLVVDYPSRIDSVFEVVPIYSLSEIVQSMSSFAEGQQELGRQPRHIQFRMNIDDFAELRILIEQTEIS